MAMATLNSFRNNSIKILVISLMTLGLIACASNHSAPVNNAWHRVDSTQKTYIVQPGDTIYSVAWKFGVKYQNIAEWNNLEKPYALKVGQALRLTAAPPKPKEEPVVSENAATDTEATTADENKIEPTPVFVPESADAATTTSSAATNPTDMTTSAVAPATAAPKPAPMAKPPAEPDSLPGSTADNWDWPAQGKVLSYYGQQGNKGIDIGVPVGTPVKAVQPGSVVYAGDNLHGYGKLIIIKQKNDLMTAYAHNSKLLVSEGSTVKRGQQIALSGNSEASQAMLHFEVRKAGKPVDPSQYLQQ